MLPHRTTAALLICLALFTSGCVRQLGKALADLSVIQQELTAKYGEPVNVHINQFNDQSSLTITFINSKLNDLSKDARTQRALESVQIAKGKYTTNKPPDRYFVSFIKSVQKLIIFNYSATVDYFAFDGDLKPVEMNSQQVDVEPIPEISTRVNYYERVGQSDVFVTPLTINGPTGKGLSVSTYFTVKGDANQRNAKPPESVHLDFNSYYKVEKYQDDVVFRFIVDGKSVVQTTGRFTRWIKDSEKIQFCYLTFPYQAFKRMTQGEELTIRVGESDYPLTEEQYKAIKQMTAYIE